ncbi:hypothetical protein CBR_g29996 [Chara braunii]|uniref:Uncharacterized protein n=1 Tax=Chara braunii TaxID=69332 RepID=A0A388LC19_CHABU|nr:hypothetical protein CBR_g29996 [Chara braunii]|eukprot:GBG79732.1 hypothetical protein CBR_g29996 [Chara braunii]
MGCDDDHSIEATKKLAGHMKLTIDWRTKVLFALTSSRLTQKSREIALAEGIVSIKWKDMGDVTSIAPFGNDPLEADIRSEELKEAVAATKSHTFVLGLCEVVDLKMWKPQAFDTLDSQLQTWCPSHWTLVVFMPRQHNLSFKASMNHLSFEKLLEGETTSIGPEALPLVLAIDPDPTVGFNSTEHASPDVLWIPDLVQGDKREEVERQSLCIMSMSVAQVAKTLIEVMKYAEEGFHYNGRGELSLLEERVPRYFVVSVDMRSTIMANGSGCVQARTLLERLRESPDVRVDSDAEDGPYSLKGVLQWMCSEGMCDEGLVDMTMQQKGGTYTPVAFRKFMLCDLTNKTEDDRNVIHEALHEVTEYAVQGRDLIDFVSASAGEEIISGRPLWGGLLGCALERLGLATCDVERQREREEGWRLIANETGLPIIEETGETSAAQDTSGTMVVDGSTMHTSTTEDLVYMDMGEGFFLGEQQLAERIDDAEHRDDAEEEDEEEYEGSDVEVSGSDVSSNEEDDDNDVYYDLKTACGQVTKGWAHAILRLARVFSDPHNVLRVVFKGATPDGAMQYAAEMDSGPRMCDCGRPFMFLRTLNSHRARACPAVADEGAQRQENDVAHDPGPSNIGATNLAGDESEDAGPEDDANGAAGDNAEPAAQPVEPFDSLRRLVALIFSARGGVDMSHTDVDALLSLLKDPRFSATDIAYRNSREFFAWAGSLAEAAGWKELDLRSDDWPREAHAVSWHRDWRTAFLSIMHVTLQKCETVYSLEVSPPSKDNSVSGPRSGALSYHTQSIIRAHKGVDKNGYSRYVIPLSLYSDKTHTDGRQKQTAYPLMMSLADHASEATLLAYLPMLHHRPRDKGWGLQSTAFRKRKAVIFHKALSTVLQAAKEASHDDITIPSTRSETLKTQLAAVVFTADEDDVHRAAEGRMAELDMHRHVEQNDLWGFYRGPSADDPQLDYHLALQPDRMHTIEHGIFLHMIDAFRVAAFEKLPNTPQTEILKELDARLQCASATTAMGDGQHCGGERWRINGEGWSTDEKDGAAIECVTMARAVMAAMTMASAAMGGMTIVRQAR